jgi:signal transduction histidine kinase
MIDGVRHRSFRLAAGLWIVTAVVAVTGIVFTGIAWPALKPSDSYANVACGLASLLYATLGILILRRVRNAIGWLLIAAGLSLAVVSAASGYAVGGILAHPGAFPAARVVGLFGEWSFVPAVASLTFMFLLFPTGTLPSRRWRPVAVAGLAATGLALVGFIVVPRTVALPAPGGISLTYANPLAIRSLGPLASTVLLGTLPSLTAVSAAILAAGFVALVGRCLRGGTVVREQAKWVASVAAVFALGQAAALISLASCHCTDTLVSEISSAASAVIGLFGIPAVIAVAILKYRLYDIDVIISRAVVYALLAGAFTGVYALIVAGIGTLGGYSNRPVLTTTAAVVIALLFQPFRRGAQRLANRMVYGERATPYEVLSEFAENMAGTIARDEVLDRMVAVLAAGTGATRIDVWITVGPQLRAVATWPRERTRPEPVLLRDGALPPFEDMTRTVAVRQGDELLGAIALEKPRNESLTPTEDKLVQDLASQAGLVLRNVRLTAELRAKIEELRASRRRLVEAQDAERRRLERNLHDGAQQQLVALNVQLGLLGRLAEDPARVRETAQRLQVAVGDALEDLRDLARGIYPPLLADRGLAVALEAQARKAAVPTTLESDGVGRYRQDVEAAVYFSALEALQNVAKYARATSAAVRLAQSDGILVFEIADDGRGFDPATTGYGTGLQGIADRLDAIGGRLEVRSEPGRGTVVHGSISIAATPSA